MTTPDRILTLLYEGSERAWPIDELSRRAGAGANTVRSALTMLQERGHELEFLPASGVRLVRPVRPDAALIEHRLGTRRVGRNVICFDQVGSTNDVAFDSARRHGADGLVVLAESQRKGRGRLGRQWTAQAHSSVLMSVLLADGRGQLAHDAVTIAAGEAVAWGVRSAAGVACELKWPNDVLLDGRKLAGVLVEVRKVGGVRCVVVGMGINVTAAPPAREIGRRAACVADKAGAAVERVEIVRAVLARLDHWVDLIAGGRQRELHDAWMARCDMLGRRIEVRCRGRRIEGRVLDIRPLEGMVLALDSGQTVELPAEHASLDT